jgi:predicted small lipoprotein YifL
MLLKEGIFLKKMMLRVLSVALVTAMLFTVAGCKKKEPVETTPTTVATTTTAPPVRYLNILTGEKDLENPDNRPVAFMIGNSSYTKAPLQQKNIDKADFYVEAETEGGISRIMAVFGGIEKVPSEIGPVRSARTPFVKMVKPLDGIYCHVGGSPLGKQLIKTLGVKDLDSLTQVSQQLRTANGNWVEHTKVFPLTKVKDAVKTRKYATTTATQSPYVFGEKAGDGLGAQVQVNISSSWKSSFTYDPATKLYTKNRYGLDSQKHTSVDGDAITARNVIVMYDQRYNEDHGHISFKLESGNGILVSGGTSRQIKWSRTNNQLKFMEADGSPLTVAKGKTYVCLTSTGLASKTILK